MTLDIVFLPMSLAAKTFNAGDKIKVTVSFIYTVSVGTKITISACPYYISAGLKPLVSSCVGSTDVQLAATAAPTPMTVDILFTLLPKAQGGIENGTYGLVVWVGSPSISDFSLMFAAKAYQDNIIIVTGNPAGVWDMMTSILPFVIMVMVMSMVMSLTTPAGQEKAKKVAKEVVEVVVPAVVSGVKAALV